MEEVVRLSASKTLGAPRRDIKKKKAMPQDVMICQLSAWKVWREQMKYEDVLDVFHICWWIGCFFCILLCELKPTTVGKWYAIMERN